jgi:hypothetical protein
MNRKILFSIIILLIFIVLINFVILNKEGIVMARPPVNSSSNNNNKNNNNNNNNNNNKGGKCFSGDSTIYLEGNITKQMKNAAIGDKILSYSMRENKFVYSPIVAIPHDTNNIISKFVQIQTSSGNKLKLTPDHFIPIMKSTDISFNLITAKDISLGDTIITVDGKETVTAVSDFDCEGIYTVVTLEEFIVVNNIVASPYALFHYLGHVYYSIHKFLYKVNPDIVKHHFFGKLNKHTEQFYSKTIEIYNNL